MQSQSNNHQLILLYEERLIKAVKLFNFVSMTTKHVIPNFRLEPHKAMVDAAIPDHLAASQLFLSKESMIIFTMSWIEICFRHLTCQCQKISLSKI